MSMGRLDGKIFGSQSWDRDLTELDLYVKTLSQIISHSALPLIQLVDIIGNTQDCKLLLFYLSNSLSPKHIDSSNGTLARFKIC